MAIESIAKTLGSGSGIDIGALVTSLVEAQFAAKNQEIARREEKLDAQISGVSTLKSAITNFDAALKSLTKGGTLATQPISADENSVKVSLLPDATIKDLNASVGVTQLASAQASTYNGVMARDQQFRGGTLTIQRDSDKSGGFSGADSSVQVQIAAGDTLEAVVGKINGANAGVTASLVTDGDGVRLVVKGQVGADQAFRITGANSGLPSGGRQSLATLSLDPANTTNFTTGARAQDARVTMDGATYTRNSNTITDLIPGLKLELIKVTAAPIRLSAEKPAAALSEGVTNFVDAYNEMLAVVKEQDDPFLGVLRLDNAVDMMRRDLAQLTTKGLIETTKTGAPRTLADLGVATARDGTLSIDSTKLAKAIADFPAEVEAMFSPARAGSNEGLSAALGAIAKRMTDRKSGLTVSAETYDKQLRTLEDAKMKASEDAEALRERLTRQFSTMDARTAAYKSTQTFLDNQIKAWNRSDA